MEKEIKKSCVIKDETGIIVMVMDSKYEGIHFSFDSPHIALDLKRWKLKKESDSAHFHVYLREKE
jgi:hypothetical protein